MRVLELFKLREESYDRFTKDIFIELKNVMDVIDEMVDDEEHESVEWNAVEQMDDFILIVGVAKFPIGHKLEVESGEFVEVSEETQDHLKRMIRVGIPMKLASEGTPEEIKTYFEEKSSYKPKVRESDNVEHETAKDMAGEFAVGDLTDAQITQILWNAEQSKGKIN